MTAKPHWVIIRTWLNRAVCIAALSVHWRDGEDRSAVRSYVAGPDGLLPVDAHDGDESRENARAASRAWFEGETLRGDARHCEMTLTGWHQ